MSVSQALGNTWPVVSLINGAQSARKDIARSLSWLQGFDRVVLCFDQDTAGQQAVEEVGRAFGHCLPLHVSHLPLKDANDMLVAGREGDLVRLIWDAPKYRPRGVLRADALKERVSQPATLGLSWPWPKLTEATYGRRAGDLVCVGAGVGVGKTEFMAHCQALDITTHGLRTAVFSSEQMPAEVVRAIAGKAARKRFHVPDGSWTEAELNAAVDELLRHDSLFVYDRAEAFDWESIRETVRYLVAGEGVRSIYIDNLTAVISHADDERRSIDRLMAELGGLSTEYQLYTQLVSHLTTPEGRPHEEGGRVLEKQFTGSRAIARWSAFMVGLERNKQARSEIERNTLTVRVLKDRFTGRATGMELPLSYNPETGTLEEPGTFGDISSQVNDKEAEF